MRKTYSSYVEDGNIVKIWTQRQFEYFSRRDPKHKKKLYNLFITWKEMKRRKKYRLFDLYLICIVRWSRMSIELVDITNRIGTNWNKIYLLNSCIQSSRLVLIKLDKLKQEEFFKGMLEKTL